jgi:beta-N-acetylhexosaminidase
LSAAGHACFLVLPEGRYSSEGQTFVQELHHRLPQAALATLDPSMSRDSMDEAVRKLPDCESYAIAAFSSVAAYRGAIGLSGELPQLVDGLMASGKPVALVAFGNPYLLRNFPGVAAYLATFSTAPSSEVAAVRALFGETQISGHLPVSIPGLAQYGEGLQLPVVKPAPVSADAQ